MSERIRLRKNPANVATPQGSFDIYYDRGTGGLVTEDDDGSIEVLSGIDPDQFATSEQGALADTAVQPNGLKTINGETVVGSGNVALTIPYPRSTPITATQAPQTDLAAYSGAYNSESWRFPTKTAGWAVSGVSVGFSSYQHPSSGGQTVGTRAIVLASIEYPSGTFTALTKDGRRELSVNGGSEAIFDEAAIYIPANTQFWVRAYVYTPEGAIAQLPATAHYNNADGFALMVGTAGSAATATTTAVSGVAQKPTLTSSGSGYAANAEILCTVGGGGSGAAIYALTNSVGVVTGFRVDSGGTGYTSPTITIPGNRTGAVGYNTIPTDQTMSGIMSNAGFGSTLFGPTLITGTPADASKRVSFVCVGDSITQGWGDESHGGSAYWGGFCYRLFSTYGVPTANLGIPGASAAVTWAQTGIAWRRLSIGKGASFANILLGTNDLANGRTALQIQADITLIYNKLTAMGYRVTICTIPPRTTSSSVNTPVATESIRVAINTWIRANSLGAEAVFDVADALEASRNSGTWGSLSWTADGIHPNAAGYTQMTTAFSTITAF